MPSDDGRSSRDGGTDDKISPRPEPDPTQRGTQEQDVSDPDAIHGDEDRLFLFGGPLPQAADSSPLAAVSEGAILTSPRGRGHLPPPISLRPLLPAPGMTPRQTAWVQILKRLRGEHAYQDLSALDNLEQEVRFRHPVIDTQSLVEVIKENMETFREKLQGSELGLSEQTQKRVLKDVAFMMMNMHGTVETMLAKNAAFVGSVSNKLCDIIGQRSQSRRNSTLMGTEETAEEVPLSKFHELQWDDLMKKTKKELAGEYMARDRARAEILESQRCQLGDYEQTIEDIRKENAGLKEKLRHQEAETRKMIMDKVDDGLGNMGMEKPGGPIRPRRPNPVRTETQASSTFQISEIPIEIPPSGPAPIEARQDHLSQFGEDIDAATPSDTLEAEKRQHTLKELHKILSKAHTESELARQYAQQNAGLGSSVPPSTRSPLTITSSSSSKTTPFRRPNTADSAAQMPSLGQHTLHDELDSDDLASAPQTGAGVRFSSDFGLPTHGNATLPGQWQQEPGVEYGFYEDHELLGYEIGRPTPSTLSLNILARFVERSSLAPSRISDLVKILIQIGKIDEEPTPILQSLKHLDATAKAMQREKPTALTETQLERGSSQVVLDWIFDAESYLDGFVELVVDRAEDMAVAADLWQRMHDDDDNEPGVGADSPGNRHVYDDPEWVQHHPKGPCPDCVPVLEYQQELSSSDGNSDAAEKDDDKREEGVEEEDTRTSTRSQTYASARTSVASRDSGGGSSRRSVTFAEPERQLPQFGIQRRRPPRLNLSRALPGVVEDVAERQLTPHLSTTRSSDGSTSSRAFQTPPLQMGSSVSPMLEIPDQENESAPAVDNTTTESAILPFSSPDATDLRGKLIAEGRPRVKDYICKDMAGHKQSRSQRPVAKESGASQERSKTKERSHGTEQSAENQQLESEKSHREQGRLVDKQQLVGDTAQYTELKQTGGVEQFRTKQRDINTRPAGIERHIKARAPDNADKKGDQMQAGERLEPHPAPALWQQFLVLLYGLIRWLTWGQFVNLYTVSAFIPSLLKYCWNSFQHEIMSGMLTPDLRRHTLRPLQSPKIPGIALSSLCLWVLLAWNTVMMVSMKEERRLWLAANPRTASYLRGLSSRRPYPWWSPFEVDYALLEPAWNGFSVWLHGAYFHGGLPALVEAFYQGHTPVVVKSSLSYLAHRSKVALMQAGIEERQDILLLILSLLKSLAPRIVGFYAIRTLLDWAAAGSLGQRVRRRLRSWSRKLPALRSPVHLFLNAWRGLLAWGGYLWSMRRRVKAQ